MSPPNFRIPFFASAVCLICCLANLDQARGFQNSRIIPSSVFSHKDSLTVLSATKVKAKKRKRRKQRNGKAGIPLSMDELSDHVSGSYNAGRKGLMGGTKAMSRGVFAKGDECGQAESIKNLNGKPALVLNADYQPLSYLPLSLWSWQEAVKAVFSGKVQVVDVYPDTAVRAANLEIPLPSVIALTEYVKQGSTAPAFTRRNVFLRDEYRCQYCGEQFHTADLSLDHVVPRCRGGQLIWENAVTCCKHCNGKKGSTPLSKLSRIGMRLLNAPRVPTQMELAAKAARMVPRRVHPTWKPYIGLASAPIYSSATGAKAVGDEQFIDDRYFAE